MLALGYKNHSPGLYGGVQIFLHTQVFQSHGLHILSYLNVISLQQEWVARRHTFKQIIVWFRTTVLGSRIKIGQISSTCIIQGSSSISIFRLKALLAWTIYWRGRIHWVFHTLAGHLKQKSVIHIWQKNINHSKFYHFWQPWFPKPSHRREIGYLDFYCQLKVWKWEA